MQLCCCQVSGQVMWDVWDEFSLHVCHCYDQLRKLPYLRGVKILSSVMTAVTFICDDRCYQHQQLGPVLLLAGIPLGIIPRGTANAFSVALDIPTHIDDPTGFQNAAADVILEVRNRTEGWLKTSSCTP